MGKVHRDTPITELTLRRYEKPYGYSKRELIKKLCLSLGLLNPGDSRDVIVDILYTIIESGGGLSSKEIKENVVKMRKANSLDLRGVADSNIRRQLKRLRELFIIEKRANSYVLPDKSSILEVFREKVKGFVIPSIVSRIEEYITKIDEEFRLGGASPSKHYAVQEDAPSEQPYERD